MLEHMEVTTEGTRTHVSVMAPHTEAGEDHATRTATEHFGSSPTSVARTPWGFAVTFERHHHWSTHHASPTH